MSRTMAKSETTTPRRWLERGPLASLRDEIEDVFENFFGGPDMSQLADGKIPSIDVSETEEAIEVATDLPGIKADDVNIEIRNDNLTISGESTEVTKTEDGNGRKYHRIERRTGNFSRSVRLPCHVQEDSVDAELKNGVLTITLPKAEEAKTKKIAVKG